MLIVACNPVLCRRCAGIVPTVMLGLAAHSLHTRCTLCHSLFIIIIFSRYLQVYEMNWGVPPFEGQSQIQLFKKIQAGKVSAVAAAVAAAAAAVAVAVFGSGGRRRWWCLRYG